MRTPNTRPLGADGLTDKERILMTLLTRVSFEAASAATAQAFAGHKSDFEHFAPFGYRPMVGDVVVCKSSGLHPCTVGIVRSIESAADMLIQELGGENTCWVRNEMFHAILNISPVALRYGAEWEFDRRVHQAFRRGDEYLYRYGGVEFFDDEAVIGIRETFGGLSRGSIPFACRMKWSRKTSVKRILEEMRAAGYGTRAFERPAPVEAPVEAPGAEGTHV